MLRSYLFVAIGGAAGSALRFLFLNILPPSYANIPLPVLFVNIVGCFLVGVLAGILWYAYPLSLEVRNFIIPGFLGGFTTFSAFAFDVEVLCEKHLYTCALSYVFLSISMSIAALFIGIKIVRWFL